MNTSRRLGLAAATVAAVILVGTTQTLAAWSEEIWNSGYNLVLRPASDTITGGSVDVWVQNNTCAILPNFTLFVAGGTAARKTVTRGDHTFLLPGENSRFTVTAANGTLVSSLKFTVHFGWHEEVKIYLEGATPVVIEDSKCKITPNTDPALDFAKDSIKNSLRYAAQVDFGLNTAEAMGLLLDAFCAGRATWTPGSKTPTVKDGRNLAYDNNCPTASINAGANQVEFDGLFELVHIAIRKAAIRPDLLPKLRSRLVCASKDPNDAFSAVTIFILGYLGEDAKARAFLEGLTTDSKNGLAAKAALLVMGKADDSTKYMADVRAGMAGGKVQGAVCMAATAIRAKDSTAAAKLIDLSYWQDTDGDPVPYTASHLLAIVAWDQKRWGPKASEGVKVSFYKDDQPSWQCTVPYTGVTGIDENSNIERPVRSSPESMELRRNFPNVSVYLNVVRPAIAEVRICTPTGRTVRSMKKNISPGVSPALQFRCDDMTTGTYIVSVHTAGVMHSEKIAVIR